MLFSLEKYFLLMDPKYVVCILLGQKGTSLTKLISTAVNQVSGNYFALCTKLYIPSTLNNYLIFCTNFSKTKYKWIGRENSNWSGIWSVKYHYDLKKGTFPSDFGNDLMLIVSVRTQNKVLTRLLNSGFGRPKWGKNPHKVVGNSVINYNSRHFLKLYKHLCNYIN